MSMVSCLSVLMVLWDLGLFFFPRDMNGGHVLAIFVYLSLPRARQLQTPRSRTHAHRTTGPVIKRRYGPMEVDLASLRIFELD